MAKLSSNLQVRYNNICSKIASLDKKYTADLYNVIDEIDDKDYIKDADGTISYLESEYTKIKAKLEEAEKFKAEQSNMVFKPTVHQIISKVISDASNYDIEEVITIKQKAHDLLEEYNNIYDAINCSDYIEEIQDKAETLKNRLNSLIPQNTIIDAYAEDQESYFKEELEKE